MAAIEQLLNIMDRLRDPDTGCPWNREQTFRTIVPHTIEEAYEVADVIEREQFDALPEELGDLLFQVVFYSRLASERGWFGFETVIDAICRKLVERHPHVFAGEQVSDAAEQSRRWEEMKAQRRKQARGQAGLLDGVPLSLPALSRAAKLQRRAATVGFDWPSVEPVMEKVMEELNEVRAARAEGTSRTEQEVGDLLFACVNLARHLQVDPEQALRNANSRFDARFRYLEARIMDSGREWGELSASELDALWEEAKREV